MKKPLQSLSLLLRAMGVALALMLATRGAVWAQDLNPSLREEVLMIVNKGGLASLALETTVYRPPGEGPFPLVVINHGKAAGEPRYQGRYRPASVARFFLARGYAVVVPMRQGFSKSEGSYIGGGCNVESNGYVQAEDLKATLDDVVARPWADGSRILVIGQSHGGWTTLAFGTLNYPGVRGLVNFAGGLRQDSCAGWQGVLARAAGPYGRATRIPSIWFYGDNDSFFAPTTFRPLHEYYVAAGGRAELVAFGDFGGDAHGMFGSRAGESIWQPRVQAFMRSIDLPTEVKFPELVSVRNLPIPARTHFADLQDVEAIPYLRAGGRDGYRAFLSKSLPRAFALSPTGAWGWAEMGDDPLERALANCNRNSKDQPCRLYAVDDGVVWVKE